MKKEKEGIKLKISKLQISKLNNPEKVIGGGVPGNAGEQSKNGDGTGGSCQETQHN